MDDFDMNNWGVCKRCGKEDIPTCNDFCEDCWSDKINYEDDVKKDRRLYNG